MVLRDRGVWGEAKQNTAWNISCTQLLKFEISSRNLVVAILYCLGWEPLSNDYVIVWMCTCARTHVCVGVCMCMCVWYMCMRVVSGEIERDCIRTSRTEVVWN